MKKVLTKGLTMVAGVALLTVAACSTTPERVDAVEEARSTLQNLERHPMAEETAATQLSKAREALSRADTALENGEPLEEIRHHAYVARRHAEIGLELIEEAKALKQVNAAEVERMKVQLQAREAAAERAEMLAEQRTAELGQARASADSAEQEASRLAQELQELEAQQTERGLVLTLSDVLFATDSAELKAGSQMAIGRLAEFLQDHPERQLLIEGHTDARGTEAYNERLSNSRANAVAEALVQRGIPSGRLQSVGLGEAYPVASNETTAGRQQNRRVEIVVSDKDGSFPDNAIRAPVVRR